MMVPTSYQKVETLYPDFSAGTLVDPECGCPVTRNRSHRTVYNLNPSAQVHPQLDKYFVYEQQQQQSCESVGETVTLVEKDSTEYVEKILKKSPEVWKHYLSGRFDVLSCLEDGCKRIILKEKVHNRKITDTSGYDIKKYRVRVSHSHHKKSKKNDEILLVTYENPTSKSFSRSKSYARTVSNSKFVVNAPSIRSSSCSSLEPTGEYVCDVAAVAGVAGPGSELIAKLIEGDDEDIVEIMKPKRTATKLEENVGRDLVGNYYLDSNDQSVPGGQTPIQEEQPQEEQHEQEAYEENYQENYDENYQEETQEEEQQQGVDEETYDGETYQQEANVDSFDEEYIEQFAPSEQTKSGSRKSSSKQESLASSRKNDRLTGSVKKALHVFNEFDDSQIYSSPKTMSKTSKTSSKTSRSSEQEVEVYNLSPLPSPVNVSRQKTKSSKSETPLSLVSSKLTQGSSRPSLSNRLFTNTSSTVTPAPPNPFAFSHNSPVSQSQYADLTGVTDERQTPVYTESITSKHSRHSRNTRTSSYRQSNGTLREEDEDQDKTFTEQSQNSSNVYDYRQSESSSKRSKNKKGSSAFSEYQQSGSKKEKSSRKKKH